MALAAGVTGAARAAASGAAALPPGADDPLRGGAIVASGDLPDLAVHLINEQWSYSPLLWAYLLLALLAVAALWWFSRRWRPWPRALARSGLLALLLSPAILACGSVAILPFPVLVLAALRRSDAVRGGAPLVALPPNAMTWAGLWLVLCLALWVWDWMRAPRATHPR